MRLQSFDKITGDHAAIVSAMIKLDALAYDYLRPDELSHQNQVIEPSSNIYFAENLAIFLGMLMMAGTQISGYLQAVSYKLL